jgi:hypothetical protein
MTNAIELSEGNKWVACCPTVLGLKAAIAELVFYVSKWAGSR